MTLAAIDYVTGSADGLDKFLGLTPKVRLAAKIAPLIQGWSSQMGVKTSDQFGGLVRLSKTTKSILSATYLPGLGSSLFKNICILTGLKSDKRPTIEVGLDTMGDLTGMVGYGTDVVSLFQKEGVINLSKRTMSALKYVGGPALTLGMVWKGFKEARDVSQLDAKSKDFSSKVTNMMMKLASTIAYLALGVFTSLSVLFGVFVSPVAFLALSTTTVVLSISSYMHKKIELGK